jgi:hypothetical protein
MSPNKVARPGDALPALNVDAADVLDLETIEHETEGALIARGAAYAREYAAVEKKPTILAINLATVLIALRRKHGDPLGRSHAYRQDANEVYRQAGIPQDQRERLQANVRYHIGNMNRRYLTPREIKAIGLDEASPLEKQQDRRATDIALLAAVKASVAVEETSPKKAKPSKGTQEKPPEQAKAPGMIVRATADHLRLASAAAKIIDQLDEDVIGNHMTDGQRAKLDEELAAIEKAARRLRRYIEKRRSAA